jgi:hypothetical protein
MASAQNISVEVNTELAALVAKLEAQLAQTEKALDICFNRLPIMDRMAAQAEFREWLGANDAHYLIGSQNVVKITG